MIKDELRYAMVFFAFHANKCLLGAHWITPTTYKKMRNSNFPPKPENDTFSATTAATTAKGDMRLRLSYCGFE